MIQTYSNFIKEMQSQNAFDAIEFTEFFLGQIEMGNVAIGDGMEVYKLLKPTNPTIASIIIFSLDKFVIRENQKKRNDSNYDESSHIWK